MPDVFADPGGLALDETAKAINFYTTKKKAGGKGFVYAIYGREEVKKAVSDLSYDKCAYCEINARASHDGDVEHFRPKGEVKDGPSISRKPGYYWLGAHWENLFLSCQHCNQERRQFLVDGTRKLAGKKNQFPLKILKKRVTSHKKSVHLEEPYRLLIDPCIDEPLDLLEFDTSGMVYPKKLADGSRDEKGSTSIEVFALFRKFLVEARQEAAIKLMAALKSYEDDARLLNANMGVLPAAYIAEAKKNLQKKIDDLKVFSAVDKEFSGMSFYIIREFLAKMGIVYTG